MIEEDSPSDLMFGRSLSKSSESVELYQKLLSYGQTKHVCQVCSRHMTDEELKPFESYVRNYIFCSRGPYNQRTTRSSVIR